MRALGQQDPAGWTPSLDAGAAIRLDRPHTESEFDRPAKANKDNPRTPQLSGRNETLSSPENTEGVQLFRDHYGRSEGPTPIIIGNLQEYGRDKFPYISAVLPEEDVRSAAQKQLPEVEHLGLKCATRRSSTSSQFNSRRASVAVEKDRGLQPASPQVSEVQELAVLDGDDELSEAESCWTSGWPGDASDLGKSRAASQAIGKGQNSAAAWLFLNETQIQECTGGSTADPSRFKPPSRGPSDGRNGPGQTPSRKHDRPFDLTSDDDDKTTGNEVGARKRRAGGRARTFACPFEKRDPFHYGRCRRCTLTKINRVKQHLLRYHCMPPHCPRCGEEGFRNKDDRDEHIATSNCMHSPRPSDERISEDKQARLRKRLPSKKPDEDKWFDIFDICFPGRPRPSSPYVDFDGYEAIKAFLGSASPKDGMDELQTRLERYKSSTSGDRLSSSNPSRRPISSPPVADSAIGMQGESSGTRRPTGTTDASSSQATTSNRDVDRATSRQKWDASLGLLYTDTGPGIQNGPLQTRPSAQDVDGNGAVSNIDRQREDFRDLSYNAVREQPQLVHPPAEVFLQDADSLLDQTSRGHCEAPEEDYMPFIDFPAASNQIGLDEQGAILPAPDIVLTNPSGEFFELQFNDEYVWLGEQLRMEN